MMILKAIELAKKAHKGQKRRFSDQPYIIHPARVAAQVSLLQYVDQEMIAAAWLHDLLEDTTTSYNEIVRETNPVVAELVKELTFDETNLDGFTYEQRKQVQNAHIANASFKAKSLKILDRLDNLEDFERNVDAGTCPLGKLTRYVKTSWELPKIFGSQFGNEVDLDLVVKLRLTLLRLVEKFSLHDVIS